MAIVVVEPVAFYGLSLGFEFDASGWNAVCATSGAKVLEHLASAKVEAVLADLDLPGMRGDELAREVRRRFPMVKMLLMTDLPKGDWPPVPKEVPILPKPISVKDFLAVIRFMHVG